MKNRIALLAATLMIATAVSGVAYAYWTDQLTVVGTINTATFGWNLTLEGWDLIGDRKGVALANAILINNAEGIPKTLEFTLDNLYPGVFVELEWDIHFYGSVPGHIREGDITYDLTIDLNDGSGPQSVPIPDWLWIGCRVRCWRPGVFPPTYIDGSPIPIPISWLSLPDMIDFIDDTQWDESHTLDITFWIELVEPDIMPGVIGEPPQGATIVLTLTINGVQYNYNLGITPPGYTSPP